MMLRSIRSCRLLPLLLVLLHVGDSFSAQAHSILLAPDVEANTEATSKALLLSRDEHRPLPPPRLLRELQQVIGFADPEVCYPALDVADANRDRIVNQQEYVTFCKEMGPPGYLNGIDTFDDLPLVLQSNFNVLACLCQTDPADDSCCVGDGAGIRTDGAYEDDVPSPEQESYLFIVCSLTASAIERVLQSAPPTPGPSVVPSASPTLLPTVSPTVSPSEAPTEAPTTSPTQSPTVTPGTPTASPTTGAPSTSPSGAPTAEPTAAAPTVAPEPTAAPQPIEEQVMTAYFIGVESGAERSVYQPQLVDAMDSLAPEVLASVLEDFRRRLGQRRLKGGQRQRQHRRLQSVNVPTDISDIQVVDCPDGIPEGDVCEVVMATITLIFQPDATTETSQEEISDVFVIELEAAIAQGQLQDALNLVWPNGDVYVIDDTLGLPGGGGGGGTDDDTNGEISSGGITGIVVGALAAVLVVGLFASRRRPPKEELEDLEPAVVDEEEIDVHGGVEVGGDEKGGTAAGPSTPEKELEKEIEGDDYDPEFAATLGASSPDYGKFQDAMMDNDDAIASMSLDSSSNAGSSGWSSSAGVSSLNTGSHDGLSAEGPISAFGATLAALGLAQEPGATTSPGGAASKQPVITRADLDSAIESGDWAAVGATAALLAAASDSQSYSSQSGNVDQSGTISRSESNDSSLDAARAAELDHLVESGDWEGVVLAAAKYEAAESGSSANSPSSRGSPGSPTLDSGSYTSSASKAKKRQELRAEVEELVQRVVPEEIQNVDEMMQQFRGREEELIETLRTMEERAVAQKARQGAQRQAKTQAKQKTPEERDADAVALLAAIPGPGSPHSEEGSSVFEEDSPAVARSLGTGQITSAAKSLGTGQVEGTSKSKSLGTGTISDSAEKPSGRDRKQSALEEAIEAGDWEAVGQAAAMLSDHSLASSVETDEINRLADGLSSQGSDLGSSKGNLSDRAEELEELIERGDWTGVVNAAASKTSESAAKKREAEEEVRRQRRLKHRKEEEEALAQASIWEAIAERSREEAEQQAATTTDRAASDAADWAIGRSLQALVQAEQGDRLTREEDSSRADTSANQDTSTQTGDEEEV